MPQTVYLEAASRTQDLFTTKWILRSCGYVVASTWHEEPVFASSGPHSHWAWPWQQTIKSCDTLVVVRGPEKELPPDLAYTVGFATACGLRVIWVGRPVDLPGGSGDVQYFATPADLHTQLLSEQEEERRSRALSDPIAA
jgi:hypothetical protein